MGGCTGGNGNCSDRLPTMQFNLEERCFICLDSCSSIRSISPRFQDITFLVEAVIESPVSVTIDNIRRTNREKHIDCPFSVENLEVHLCLSCTGHYIDLQRLINMANTLKDQIPKPPEPNHFLEKFDDKTISFLRHQKRLLDTSVKVREELDVLNNSVVDGDKWYLSTLLGKYDNQPNSVLFFEMRALLRDYCKFHKPQ